LGGTFLDKEARTFLDKEARTLSCTMTLVKDAGAGGRTFPLKEDGTFP